MVEFFDYNCPYCRTAVKDIHELIRVDTGLRVGIVNNPILSQMSAQAAKVELALMILKDQSIIYDFHQRLFKRRGVIDGSKALDIAVGLGVPRSRIEEVANGPKVEGMLSDQMRLAASLGVSATPSFVIAGAGLSATLGRRHWRGSSSLFAVVIRSSAEEKENATGREFSPEFLFVVPQGFERFLVENRVLFLKVRRGRWSRLQRPHSPRRYHQA